MVLQERRKEAETIPKNIAEVVRRIQKRHVVSYAFSRWKILPSVVSIVKCNSRYGVPHLSSSQ